MPRGIKKAPVSIEQPGIESGVSKPDSKSEERNKDFEGRTETSSGASSIPTVSPIDLASGAATGSIGDGDSSGPAKRRGRQPGSKNRATQTQSAEDLADNLAGILYGAHSIIAALARCPELELEESEAKKLADKSTAVLKYYQVSLDPKKLAWLQLGMCAVEVYGPRALIIYRGREQKPTSTVHTANSRPDGTVETIRPVMPESKPNGAPAPMPRTPMEMSHEYPREEALE